MFGPNRSSLGIDEPIVSAQTDKIIHLRQRVHQNQAHQQFMSAESVFNSLSSTFPNIVNPHKTEKTFQFNRCVPYSFIHANLDACRINPPRPSEDQASPCRTINNSNNRINSAINHIDQAKRILSGI